MAWGISANSGIDDIVERLRRNDAALTSLYLMRTRRFDESGARALGEALTVNTTLRELHLSSHRVSPDQARCIASGLAKNRTVRHVSIGDSTLGDEALIALCDGFGTSSSLETLDVEKKGLTRSSCGPLAEAVLRSGAIRHVMLSDNDLGDQGVADFLRCASRLEALELCECLKDAKQWKLVAQTMAETSSGAVSLRRLELDRNALDEEGARGLAGSLPQLSALEFLSLNGNPELGSRGVRALAFPRSLRRLDIGSTGAGDDGLHGIAELIVLGELPNLNYINVCGCGVTSVGLAALIDSLAGLAKDVEVDAGGNDLDDGAETLMASVVRCERLQSLRLHGCTLGEAGVEALVRVLVASGGTGETGKPHALRDLDISGNGIPEASMLRLLDALPLAISPRGLFPLLKTLIVAANPDVEGPAIAERVESLTGLGIVIMRAANDGDK